MKLYRVKLRGMQLSMSSYAPTGDVYVLAEDAESAHQIVKKRCDDGDYGFEYERELHSVTLLADPDGRCGMRLLGVEGEEDEVR